MQDLKDFGLKTTSVAGCKLPNVLQISLISKYKTNDDTVVHQTNIEMAAQPIEVIHHGDRERHFTTGTRQDIRWSWGQAISFSSSTAAGELLMQSPLGVMLST